MRNRHRRVLWLLNHKTLMSYEVKLLMDLKFEVFTPKVIPTSSHFRSGMVDFTFDKTLTLPSAALERLNQFNFYEKEWPEDIVKLVNRYFGTVYTIPYSIQVKEVVQKFEGQILFRAFGLDNTLTYKDVLQGLYGSEIYSAIWSLKNRFWFAPAYEELMEVEPPLIAKQTLFLPIGVPDSFWVNKNTFVGTDNRILFLCPNCVSNAYYAAMYKKFKSEFGDLPHVIIGTQDTVVEDPNVLGFISDDALLRLYRECAVLYYPSEERRHIHYSPVEAAINGMPVIYYADSLLGRMTPEITLGRSHNLQEARASIERILTNDKKYIANLRLEQQSLAYKFSNEYCTKLWKENLSKSGYYAALKKDQNLLIWRKVKLFLFTHVNRYLKRSSKHNFVPKNQLSLDNITAPDDQNHDFDEVIDFSKSVYPSFVWDVMGLSGPESWGRWSINSAILIKLEKKLPSNFKLVLEGGGYGPNIGVLIQIKIGREKKFFTFQAEPNLGQKITLDFSLKRSSDFIEITVPTPVSPPGTWRQIGIGLSSLKIIPSNLCFLEYSRSEILDEAIDFSKSTYPEYVDSIRGVSWPEPWGAWSKESVILIKFMQGLPQNFKFILAGGCYGTNIGKLIKVKIGTQKQFFTFLKDPELGQEIILEYFLKRPTDLIEITIPEPTMIPGSDRQIGLGLSFLKIVPIERPALSNATHEYKNLSEQEMDFSKALSSEFVKKITGISYPEPWGAWSTGSLISIKFIQTLPQHFKLVLAGGCYGPNIGALIQVKIGTQKQFFTFLKDPELGQEIILEYFLKRPTDLIEITIPEPTMIPGSERQIGLGLSSLKIIAIPNSSKFLESHLLESDIDFSLPTYPAFIKEISGVSDPECWGRWSIGSLTSIKFSKPLPLNFKLIMCGGCYGPNGGKLIKVKIGKEKQFFTFRADKIDQKAILEYSLKQITDVIEIFVPKPVIPPKGNRKIGLGFSYLKIVPIIS